MLADAPSRTDRSLLLYFVLPVEFCAAVAVLLHWVDWESVWRATDLAWWATTLQFVGALIASGGLLYAYRRASRPTPVVVRPGTAHLYLFGGSAFGVAPFRLDRTASPEDQLAQLEDFVNGLLVERFTSISRRIGKLEHEVKRGKGS